MSRQPRRRAGTAALETVLCAIALMAFAAAGYAATRAALEAYQFDLGTALGSPLM